MISLRLNDPDSKDFLRPFPRGFASKREPSDRISKPACTQVRVRDPFRTPPVAVCQGVTTCFEMAHLILHFGRAFAGTRLGPRFLVSAEAVGDGQEDGSNDSEAGHSAPVPQVYDLHHHHHHHHHYRYHHHLRNQTPAQTMHPSRWSFITTHHHRTHHPGWSVWATTSLSSRQR